MYNAPRRFNPFIKHKRNTTYCKFCDSRPGFSTPADYRAHLVAVHGCKQVGAQVFLSFPCKHCDKPALYRVATVGYCKDHRALATDRRITGITQIKERQARAWAEKLDATDAILRSQQRLRIAVNSRNKPKP